MQHTQLNSTEHFSEHIFNESGINSLVNYTYEILQINIAFLGWGETESFGMFATIWLTVRAPANR
jgi:hypothetical protein